MTKKAQPTSPSAEEIAEMRSLIGRFPRVQKRSSLQIFRASLFAFTLREMRDRFGRSRAGYAWAILQPMIFLVGLVALREAMGRGKADIYGVSGAYFFWLGLVPFFMFINGLNSGMGSTRLYRSLFQFRQVQPIDVMLVRVLIQYATMIVVFAILLIGFIWTGHSIEAQNWFALSVVFAALLAFTFGCVLLAEVAILKYPDARQVIGIIERPLIFISGTFYTIDQVPPGIREYLMWNPLLHGVDLARGVMLGQYEPIGSWYYFVGSALVALTAGLVAYRRNRPGMIAQ